MKQTEHISTAIIVGVASILMGVAVLVYYYKPQPTTPAPNPAMQSIDTITIDSCQYIVISGYRRGGISHKGNCKNH